MRRKLRHIVVGIVTGEPYTFPLVTKMHLLSTYYVLGTGMNEASFLPQGNYCLADKVSHYCCAVRLVAQKHGLSLDQPLLPHRPRPAVSLVPVLYLEIVSLIPFKSHDLGDFVKGNDKRGMIFFPL